jgi:hypothetical protein
MVCGRRKVLNMRGRSEVTRSFKAWVAGSNPAALTRFFNDLPSLARRADVY